MMIRCFFNPSLQQSGCCRGLKKPAFESPKRGLSVTDTPAGGPTSVLFASSVENSFRRLTTTPYERTMRNGRLNEWFSFPRFLAFRYHGHASCLVSRNLLNISTEFTNTVLESYPEDVNPFEQLYHLSEWRKQINSPFRDHAFHTKADSSFFLMARGLKWNLKNIDLSLEIIYIFIEMITN